MARLLARPNMVDHLTKQRRSEAMATVQTQDTPPELQVRRLIHSKGYRFSLHRKDLPGRPDIVLPRLNKIIFVHGCFWHRHSCRRLPKSNLDYWQPKLEENARRDRRNMRKLKKMGWEVFVVWECWTKRPEYLEKKLATFLAR